MDFLGIGPLELLFVFIIILIVLGPNDMVKVGASLGRFLRQLMKSDTWRVIQDTSREIRGLPTRLARQAGLEEFEKELRDGIEFPKIGDLPKKIEAELKEELKLDSWTQPATEVPEQPAGEAAASDLSDHAPPPAAADPSETVDETPAHAASPPETRPDSQAEK